MNLIKCLRKGIRFLLRELSNVAKGLFRLYYLYLGVPFLVNIYFIHEVNICYHHHLADNTQPYAGQPYFLTGTHMVIKAARRAK